MFLGPILGGFLAPDFHHGITNKASRGYPFAVPSMLIAGYCVTIAALVYLMPEPQQVGPRNKRNCPTPRRSFTTGFIFRALRMRRVHRADPTESEPLLHSNSSVNSQPRVSSKTPVSNVDVLPADTSSKLPFRKMWTANVIRTMLATFLISGHLGTFVSLWPLFLSAPGRPRDERISFLHLSGGLNMDSRQVAVFMSLLGSFGVFLQIVIYPSLNDRFGTIRLWRSALWFFPVAYFIAPFLTVVEHTRSSSGGGANQKALLWTSVLFVLLLFTTGRTGVTPATSLLINDCTPHPSVRGTIHTSGTVFGNLGRSIFPAIILPVFGYGLQHGMSGLGFWCLGLVALLTCAISRLVEDGGNGTEIVIEENQARGCEVNEDSESQSPVAKSPRVAVTTVEVNC